MAFPTDSLLSWYEQFARDLPWRAPGTGAWPVLVSEVMLQQTPVRRVLPAWTAWMRRWPTPGDLAAATPGEAVRQWDRLGYPRRALRLHACAVALCEHHDGRVPADVDALLALPGIGPYTARAVAVFAHGQRHPVVDTNVRRVVARAVLGQGEAAPPSAVRDHATVTALLPESPAAAARFSVALMELGALVCTSRVPRCSECPLSAGCAWRLAGSPAYDGRTLRPLGAPPASRRSFAGSDRQVRGLLMAVLREAEAPVPRARLDLVWPDAAQRDRALHGLVTDGLAEPVGTDLFALPS